MVIKCSNINGEKGLIEQEVLIVQGVRKHYAKKG